MSYFALIHRAFLTLGFLWVYAPVYAASVPTATLCLQDSKGNVYACGGGFFVSDDGLIVTARHVIRGASAIAGKTGSGEDFKITGVAADDPFHDLVILKTDRKQTPHLTLGSFHTLRLRQEVRVIGNVKLFHGATYRGVIRTIHDLAGGYQTYTIEAEAVEGLSGSPVINGRGDVVGLIVGQSRDHSVGTVESSDSIKELLKKVAGAPLALTKLRKRPFDGFEADPAFIGAMDAFGRKNHQEAIRQINVVMVHFPQCAVLYAVQGSFYSGMKAWSQAEKSYRRAIELQPKYGMAWAFLSAVLTLQNRREEAIAAGVMATSLRPDLPEAWINLGSAYAFAKRSEEARRVLKKLRSLGGEEAALKAALLETLLTNSEAKK